MFTTNKIISSVVDEGKLDLFVTVLPLTKTAGF